MYKEKIQQYFSKNRDVILEDIKALCRIPSVKGPALEGMPFGLENAKALACAMDMAKNMGLTVKNYDNYVMAVDFNDKPTQLAILAHLDVVHEGTGWTVTEPYQPIERDGKIYGRGTADDKGPAVVSLYAMKAIRDMGIPLSRNVRLILGCDEESGSSDLKYYFSKETAPPMSFSPDSSYPVTNIEKGGIKSGFDATWPECTATPRILTIDGGRAANIVPQEAVATVEGITAEQAKACCNVPGIKFTVSESGGVVTITALGQSAHASNPDNGKNAITGLCAALCSMPLAQSTGFTMLKNLAALIPHGDTAGKHLGVAQADDISGALTLNFGMIKYTTTSLWGKLDSRTPICANPGNMSTVVAARLKEIGITLETTEMNPPHHTDENSDFIKTLNGVYQDYSGQPGGCMAIGGGTYVHHIEGGVAFGCSMPGTENFMHGPDEFAVIEELMLSAAIFTQVIIDICK